MSDIDEGNRATGDHRLADMAAVLAVAELRLFALAAVGGASLSAEAVVCAVVRGMKGAGHEGPIREALIARVVARTGGPILAQAARDPMNLPPRPPRWAVREWPLPLGDAAWLGAVTEAGARAVPLSLDAPGVWRASSRMVDFVIENLGGVWRRAPEDTRPLGRR